MILLSLPSLECVILGVEDLVVLWEWDADAILRSAC